MAINNVKKLFPSLKKLLRIVLTYPITSNEAERSFSLLRRLNSSLRSTMTQGRLNSLELMCSAPVQTDSILDDEVVSMFLPIKNRKFDMSH